MKKYITRLLFKWLKPTIEFTPIDPDAIIYGYQIKLGGCKIQFTRSPINEHSLNTQSCVFINN